MKVHNFIKKSYQSKQDWNKDYIDFRIHIRKLKTLGKTR